jgi:hypothetical protein
MGPARHVPQSQGAEQRSAAGGQGVGGMLDAGWGGRFILPLALGTWGAGGAGRCSEEDAAARPGKKRLRGVGAGLPMERRETRMREDGRDSDGREDTRTA